MSIFNGLISRIRNKLVVKTYDDEYLRWLKFGNVGMLHPGNIYSFKYVIENLPSNDPIVEIGSFCGLSTNVICYLLEKYGRNNIVYCCDKWIFEGSDNSSYLGSSLITHEQYRHHIKDSFIKNISFFSNKRPYPIEVFSDEFFNKWGQEKELVDIFDRKTKLGGKISFCYIDGNHTYEFAKRDFDNANENLVWGGFVMFDDSSDNDPFGLTKLMREITNRSDYKLILKNPNYLFQKCKNNNN